jgi:hypothetical protein
MNPASRPRIAEGRRSRLATPEARHGGRGLRALHKLPTMPVPISSVLARRLSPRRSRCRSARPPMCAAPSLYANYVPNCTFAFLGDGGAPGTTVAPGAYQLVGLHAVRLRNGEASCEFVQFHLTGPGVNLPPISAAATRRSSSNCRDAPARRHVHVQGRRPSGPRTRRTFNRRAPPDRQASPVHADLDHLVLHRHRDRASNGHRRRAVPSCPCGARLSRPFGAGGGLKLPLRRQGGHHAPDGPLQRPPSRTGSRKARFFPPPPRQGRFAVVTPLTCEAVGVSSVASAR